MSPFPLQFGSLLPSIILGYAPSIHFDKLSQPILKARGWSDDSQKFNEKVQVCIDKRWGQCAFKSNDYLLGFHLIQPMFGYSKNSCDRAKKELGDQIEDQIAVLEDEIKKIQFLLKDQKEKKPQLSSKLTDLKTNHQKLHKEYLGMVGPLHICKPREFYQATERILFRRILFMLRNNVKSNYQKSLEPAQVRPKVKQLVHFALNTLQHAVQDFKHLEGYNGEDGVNSPEHTFTHVCSDLKPPQAMLLRSRHRTEALLDRFKDRLIQEFGKELGVRILADLKDFHFPQGKTALDMMPSHQTIRKFLPNFPGDHPDFTF